MIMASFRIFIRQIASDAMLAVCCIAPFLAGAAFHFGLPVLDILRDYWLLADLLLATLTPFMICFASSMVILEERDEGIGAYLMVTPVGKRGYIVSRLVVPALVASVASAAILPVFGLSGLGLSAILFLSLGMSLVAVIISLCIAVLSGNRIEGMALGKLSGIILLGVVVPFFVKSPWRFLAGVFPTFWIAEVAVNGTALAIPAFIAVCAFWFAMLYPRFALKTAGHP